MPRTSRARALFLLSGLWNGPLFACAVLVVLGLVLPGRSASAADGVRLIMVEEKGCRFCAKWEQDVGPAYPGSREGQFAPLKRVPRGAPDVKGFNPVVYTPTFIVVRGGEEIGRITGYPGKRYFWSELDAVLETIGYY